MNGYGIIAPNTFGKITGAPEPICEPMDAIAEAVAWATCTSDPHQVHAGLPAGLILGHEVVARLVKVGSMVKDFKVGDIVCVGAVTPDWTWPNCQDNIHQDANGAAQGMNWCVTENGTFAERFRIRQVDCNATYIPKGLTYEHALMASDMVTTGFHGVEMAHVTWGDTVVVMGIGPVGLMSVAGSALLAAAYTLAIRGLAWSALRYMALTIVLGVAGTLLLFYGLRVIIDRLARRGDRAGKLRVFNFRQVEETVIHRSGTLAICSLLILAALCCFGAGVATARSSRAETHVLDYTFPTNSQSADEVRQTLTACGLDSAFSDIFEMRIGRVRTSTDYQNTVKFPALQRTIDAMPVSDERQQLQYMLEAVGYPHLIALSGYNHLLAATGLPELTLADDEAAVYCDSEVSLASRTALINRLIAESSAITIDGAPFTLRGQVQSVSVVTDR